MFLFSVCYIFCYRGKLPSHSYLEKSCVYESPHLFLSQRTLDYLCLLKLISRVDFPVVTPQILEIQMKMAIHAWLEIASCKDFYAF